MKKVALFATLILVVCFTSCRQDNTQLAKDEFSKYYQGQNEVALVLDDTIYFEEGEIDLKALKPDEEPNNGLILREDKFYFSTCVENAMFDYTLNIYESNLTGSEITLLFSRDGYKTHPWAYGTGEVFYIEHFLESTFVKESKRIDKFSVDSKEYESVDAGEGCGLFNYIREENNRYSIEMIENPSAEEHGKFIITDLESGAKRIIDDNYLQKTIYSESMKMFGYAPQTFDVSEGHILIAYSIGAGDGRNFPHLAFEYDFDTDTLEYKLLVFPYDSVPVELVYLE